MNGLPIFRIHCERKYTAVLKDNVYKVKFYDADMDKFPNLTRMIDALTEEGWKNIIVISGHNRRAIWFVTFWASK